MATSLRARIMATSVVYDVGWGKWWGIHGTDTGERVAREMTNGVCIKLP